MANYVVNYNLDNITFNSSGTITKSKKITLLTGGKYSPEDTDVTASVSATVQAGSLNNAATSGVTYTENTAASTVIPAEGALYINAGWIGNTKITLGHLIPDPETGKANSGAAEMRSGYVAWDGNGKKIVGTMANVTPSFTGGGLTATPSVSVTAASATIAAQGQFADLTSTTNSGKAYGVTDVAQDGTDGVNFLKIDGYFSATSNGTATPTAKAERTAVTFNGAHTGYINVSNGTIASAAPTAVSTTAASATTVTLNTTDNFKPLYIPIVNPSFDGGTVSVTASASKVNPKVTISTSASNTASNYGLSTTAPTSGTEGTNFLKVTANRSSVTNGSAFADAKASRTAVLYNGAVRGAISKADDTQALAASGNVDATRSSTAVGIDITETDFNSYYIPIVSPAGTGGGVSKNTSGNSATASVATSPSVSVASSGTFTTVTGYGITTTAPSGTDGTNYLTIVSSGTPGAAQNITGTATISYTRKAVTSDNTYKGAVSMTTSTSLLDSATGTLSQSISGSVQATSSGTPTYYVPIVKPAASGGALDSASSNSIAISGTGNITVTPSIAVKNSTGTSVESTYGITTTAPSSTEASNYVTLDPDASGGSKTITASITVGRAAVTVSSSAGLTNGTGSGLNATSVTYSQSGTNTVSTSIQAGTNKYIPIVKPSASVSSHTVTNPTVGSTLSTAAVSGDATSVSAVTYDSANAAKAASGSNGKYVKVQTDTDVTNGTSYAKAKATISAGITATGSDETTNDTKNIGVTAGTKTVKYMAVYGGEYVVG